MINENEIKWFKLNPVYTDLAFQSKQKKLPHFYHLYESDDFKDVYEPAEDTFLMIDTLEEEILSGEIFNTFGNDTQLLEKELNLDKTKNLLKYNILSSEVGCGSNITSMSFIEFLDKYILSKNTIKLNEKLDLELNLLHHYSIDINKSAVDVSTKALDKTDIKKITIKEGYFLENYDFKKLILETLNSKNEFTNIITIFNPPYVTTDKDELEIAKKQKDIVASWAGGENGSEIIFDFIKYYLKFIEEKMNSLSSFSLYLLLSSENEYSKIINELSNFKYCIYWKCLSCAKFKNESLGIFKFVFSINLPSET